MIDARIVRTRAALHNAVLELAAVGPVSEVTVSELAAQAGINRVTFYKHFASPAEALSSALGEQLQESRARFSEAYAAGTTPPFEVFTSCLHQVLDHVEANRRLYEHWSSADDSATVSTLLADHFGNTLAEHLEQRGSEEHLPKTHVSLMAPFFGHGMVGVLKAWVSSGSHDRDAFVDTVVEFTPEWCFPRETPCASPADAG